VAASPLALSADGKTLALVRPGPSVWLWDLATGRELLCLRRDTGDVNDLTFSPDGQLVAAGGYAETNGATAHGTVHIWKAATGKRLHLFKDGSGPIYAVRFAPDGKTLAAAGGAGKNLNNTIHLWEVGTGKRLRRFQRHQSVIRGLAFAPDGRMLASASDDKTVRLWQASTGRQIRRFPGHEGKIAAVAFSPSGRTLVSVTESPLCVVRLWDVATGMLQRRWPCLVPGRPRVAFSPDGRVLALAGGGNTIRLWKVATGREFPPGLQGHGGPVGEVVFLPDGKGIFTRGGATLRLWEPATGAPVLDLAGLRSPFTVAADGRTLVDAIQENDPFRVWDVATRKERYRFGGPLSSYTDSEFRAFGALALSPDGKTLVTQRRYKSQTLLLWDVSAGKQLRRLTFGGKIVPQRGLAFSPDGQRLALVFAEGRSLQTHLVDLASGQVLRRLVDQPDRNINPRFSPDGKTLFTRHSRTQQIRLWEVASGKERRRSGPDQRVRGTLSPNGKIVASASRDTSIRVWEVATGKELRRFQGHAGRVLTLQFSPDGRALVSGSSDTTALVWDVSELVPEQPPRTAPFSDRELTSSWNDLASADAVQAYRAVESLIAAGDQSVGLLRKRLRPATSVDHGRLARLVRDLDSKRYRVRVKATRELEQSGAQAEPVLRQALTERPSLEVVQRVEKLLAKLGAPISDPELLQVWRALEVLEGVGTPTARHALQRLTRGGPFAPLTLEAKAALERLARRHPVRR
jgi:WD40 repeat protein